MPSALDMLFRSASPLSELPLPLSGSGQASEGTIIPLVNKAIRCLL
jgi:hypothetical protein